jgi:hypothetical protein
LQHGVPRVGLGQYRREWGGALGGWL